MRLILLHIALFAVAHASPTANRTEESDLCPDKEEATEAPSAEVVDADGTDTGESVEDIVDESGRGGRGGGGGGGGAGGGGGGGSGSNDGATFEPISLENVAPEGCDPVPALEEGCVPKIIDIREASVVGWEVRFLSRDFADGQTTFKYEVTVAPGEKALSHFTLGIEKCSAIVASSPSLETPGAFSSAEDPTTCVEGVKFGGQDEDSTREYSITLEGDIAQGMVTYATKGGTYFGVGAIEGPNCECQVGENEEGSGGEENEDSTASGDVQKTPSGRISFIIKPDPSLLRDTGPNPPDGPWIDVRCRYGPAEGATNDDFVALAIEGFLSTAGELQLERKEDTFLIRNMGPEDFCSINVLSESFIEDKTVDEPFSVDLGLIGNDDIPTLIDSITAEADDFGGSQIVSLWNILPGQEVRRTLAGMNAQGEYIGEEEALWDVPHGLEFWYWGYYYHLDPVMDEYQANPDAGELVWQPQADK